jgi:hypothetical protein
LASGLLLLLFSKLLVFVKETRLLATPPKIAALIVIGCSVASASLPETG